MKYFQFPVGIRQCDFSNYLKLCLIALLSLVMASCDEFGSSEDSPAEKISGMWNVSENSQEFGEQHYKTEIIRNMYIDDQVSIYNFFALGSWVAVPATVTTGSITLIPSDADGWNIQGEGTISADFKQINFEFTVEELSKIKRTPIVVTAIFTRDN